jgi:hypothetical protein
MEVHSFKKGKEEKNSPSRIRFHFEGTRFAFEPSLDEGNTIMIYDQGNKKITTKISEDGEKNATITPMIKLSAGMTRKVEEASEASVEPTGRSKTIQGYDCAEYRIESEDDITLAWISPDLQIDLSAISGMANIKQVEGAQTSGSLYGLDGTMLESHTEAKDGKTSHDSYLKDIVIGEVPAEVFSLDGFKVMDIGNLFGN